MENTYQRFSSQSGLSDTDVLNIRDLATREGLTATDIGERYGIDRTTAGRIITGRTWGHVPAPKTINGYDVYPDGRIFSQSSNSFLKTFNRAGQAFVELRVKGTRQKVSVASLVAKAFLGTKSSKIAFVDGNPSNAHFTNLTIGK